MIAIYRWIVCGTILAAGAGAQAAPREATTRILDSIRAKRNEPALLEVWLNGNREGASDRDRNVLAIGDVERLHVKADRGGHLTLLRVDMYGQVRPFLDTATLDAPLAPATETAFPPDGQPASRRAPTGSEDIYVFLTPEPIPQETLWADLTTGLDPESDTGPTVAERIQKRFDGMADGSVLAARVMLRVAGRSTGTRGGPSLADYSAEDIAEHFAAFEDETSTRGGFTSRRFTGLIHFATNKFELSDRGKANLREWVKALTTKMASARFAIEGHTDVVGNPPTNWSLSGRRAEAVKAFLVEAGVAANRLVSEPHGEKAPVREGTTADALAENRRVDFRFVSMK
jgi:outer membrane protein OmpA-like peptidoglycan-associated protein